MTIIDGCGYNLCYGPSSDTESLARSNLSCRGLITGGLLESLGINNKMIISGNPNYIPIPSNLWYVVKKYREAIFMIISGSVCNCPCSMSCDKVERAGRVCIVKEISFFDGK